jgi:hypothetical protein
MIRKTKLGYEVVSHKTGKLLGIYTNEREARDRLEQIKLFGKEK